MLLQITLASEGAQNDSPCLRDLQVRYMGIFEHFLGGFYGVLSPCSHLSVVIELLGQFFGIRIISESGDSWICDHDCL
jgi:hypothetical protein